METNTAYAKVLMTRVITLAAVSFVLLSMAGIAHADILSPVLCTPLNHGPNTSYYAREDMFINTSGNFMMVTCPIVRGYANSLPRRVATPVGPVPVAKVVVFNPSATWTRCTLSSFDENAKLVDTESAITSSPDAVVELRFYKNQYASGFYSMTCQLPANGKILVYEFKMN